MNVRDNAALKHAFDEDVTLLGGPTAVASKSRVDQARISRYASISDQNITTHVPLDVLIDVARELQRRGGVSKTLQTLADQLGFKLVPRAQAEPEDAAHVGRLVGNITRAMGDLMTEAAEATADGVVDDAEKLALDVRASLLEQHTAELRTVTGGAKVVQIGTNGRGAA